MKHPFYFIFGTAICIYLLVANWRGYSLFNQAGPSRWGPRGANIYHK